MDRVQINSEESPYVKYFHKQYYASLEKYKKLYGISKGEGFISPKIIETNKKNKSITFEFIHGMQSSRESYFHYMKHINNNDRYGELFYKFGCSLAGIHDKLELKMSEPWAPCDAFNRVMSNKYGASYVDVLSQSPQAYIHCDYGFSNVNYVTTNNLNEIVILDPCPNRFVTFHACTYASIYIDLSNYIGCLDGLFPVSKYVQIDWRKLEKIKELFLLGYEERSGLTLDRHLLSCMAYATVTCYFENRYKNSMKSWAAIYSVYNGLKNNKPNGSLC